MSFIVETRKSRNGSKPGDRIRQGRVASVPRDGLGRIVLAFDPREDGCIYVLLARTEVGVICRQDAERGMRHGFNWLCFLPHQHSKPSYAGDLDKAKGAMQRVVEQWCEAAGLAARKRTHPHRHPGQCVGWRAGEAG